MVVRGVQIAAALVLLGALGGPAAAADEPLVERASSHFVIVNATVTTPRGRIVTGLDRSDFRVEEDFTPRPIEFFATDRDLPVSIAFLLDLSGSMRQAGKLDEAKESVGVFVRSLREGDRFGLVGFADDQVAWITDFTGDADVFMRRLGVQEAYGQTALFDAVAATPGLVQASSEGRSAIVLFTDGQDNASRLNTFDAVTTARRVSVPIYAIGFSSLVRGALAPGAIERRHAILRRFAEETGGALFVVRDPADLKEAVLRIQDELRHQYVIGYTPHDGAWDGSFRRIRVRTSDDDHVVRARRGYYAGP